MHPPHHSRRPTPQPPRELGLAARCAGLDVLEAGSGEGYGADLLAGVARRVVGLDYDESAVAHVRARYPRVEMVRGNLAELGLVVLLKLGLMPSVAAVVAGPVLGLSGQEVLAAVVMSSLPTAQNVFILAVAYGRGEDIARDSVLATTVLAMPAMLVVVALMGGG